MSGYRLSPAQTEAVFRIIGHDPTCTIYYLDQSAQEKFHDLEAWLHIFVKPCEFVDFCFDEMNFDFHGIYCKPKPTPPKHIPTEGYRRRCEDLLKTLGIQREVLEEVMF